MSAAPRAQLLTFGLILSGLALSGTGLHRKSTADATASWPTTTGKVVESRVVERVHETRDRRNRRYDYEPLVRYAYEVAGKTYEGRRVSTSSITATRAAALQAIGPYRKGSTVTVYYDPDDPSQAVLDTGGGWKGTVMLLFGLLLTVTGGLVLFKLMQGGNLAGSSEPTAT